MKFLFWAGIIFLIGINANAQTKDLDYFIEEGMQNSPLLNDYNNQVFSTRIDSLKLLAAYDFIVSAEGNGLYAPNFNGWGYDKDLTNGQFIFAGVRVAKEFISRNNLNARMLGFKLSIAQVIAQANISKVTLKKQITDLYIATYASQQQYNIAGEITQLLSQEDMVLKKLTQAAVFKQTDYLAFKVTMQTNQLSLLQRKAEWYNNYALLNYLSGIADTAFATLEPPNLEPKDLQPFEETPYAAGYRADSTKLANDAALIPYEYRPHITGFTDAGYQSSFVQQPYKNLGVSVGVNISLPLYDGHRKQMLLQQNGLLLNTRQKYIEQARRQYEARVSQLKEQIKQYEEMIQTANEQELYARTLIEANAKQLPTGDVKMVDFIMSINNLINLRSGLIQNQTTIYNLQNQLQHFVLE